MSFQRLTLRARRILSRRHNYRACFYDAAGKTPTASGDRVLRDLAKFCNAFSTTVMIGEGGFDSHASAVAQGRREVWLRIQSMLELSDHHLLNDLEQDDE